MEVRANDVIRAKEQAIASIEDKAEQMAKYCDTLEYKVAKVHEVEADIYRIKGVQAKELSELTKISQMVLDQRKSYDILLTSYIELSELIKQRKKDLSKFDELLIKLNA
jgi:DNA repair ATPase RecN